MLGKDFNRVVGTPLNQVDKLPPVSPFCGRATCSFSLVAKCLYFPVWGTEYLTQEMSHINGITPMVYVLLKTTCHQMDDLQCGLRKNGLKIDYCDGGPFRGALF